MASASKTIVNFSNREKALTSDLVRMGKLGSRELLNTIRDAGRRDEFTNPAGVFRGHGVAGELVPRAENLGTIVGSVGTFDVHIGAGEAEMQITTADPDASEWTSVRWSATTVTVQTPVVGTRVDLVYATPAMVPADQQSRTVLLDPVTRTTTPQNIYKTLNPLATLTYAVGTPGTPSTAVPPACPSGSLAIWEIITQSTAVDSRDCCFIRRIWRRVESFASVHGILQGCVPSYTMNTEANGSNMSLPLDQVHRVVIDGEVLVGATDVAVSGNEIPLLLDVANPPGVNAGAFDIPFYLYLCGGRNVPCRQIPGSGAIATNVAPFIFIASTTPPGLENRASASLQYPVGVTILPSATLYCGLGFVIAGSSKFKSCVVDGDWIYARTADPSLFTHGSVFNEADRSLTGATDNLVVATVPVTSTMMDVSINASRAVGTAGATLSFLCSGGAPDFGVSILMLLAQGGTVVGAGSTVRCAIPAGNQFVTANGQNGDAVSLCASAYNMNVRRLSI